MRVEHDLWTYATDLGDTRGIVGYAVEAIDGGIGKIDEATQDVGAATIVVDTGPWIFGHKVILPAGVIDRVDRDEECVYVNRTKEQIEKAPELGAGRVEDDEYRHELGEYYGPEGAGWREIRPRGI
jgi:hypothetical protein